MIEFICGITFATTVIAVVVVWWLNKQRLTTEDTLRGVLLENGLSEKATDVKLGEFASKLEKLENDLGKIAMKNIR